MKVKESMALAILRSGRSYEEASIASGLNVADVMQLWDEDQKTRRTPAPASRATASEA